MNIISVAYAQVDATKFGNLVDPIINNVVTPILFLLFTIATFVFAWGIAKMIIFADDATAKEEGKRSMLWGVVGMFIMISAWGIVYLVANTINGI